MGTNRSDCQRVVALVPGYMDGELSEEQATPLRRHLLSCRSCRAEAQDLTNLGRWFPSPGETPASLVPAGFAARVARLAFEGADGGSVEADAPRVSAGEAVQGPAVMQFLMVVTSMAAGLLLTFALVLGLQRQPQSDQLTAEPLHEILRELDELNARNGAGSPPQADQPEDGPQLDEQ